MTAMLSPTTDLTTLTGAPLPVVALPQGELLTVNIDEIPVFKDLVRPGIHIQPLRIDLERGEWVFLATLAPGCALPLHYHTGAARCGRSGPVGVPRVPRPAAGRGLLPVRARRLGAHVLLPEDNTEDTVVLAWIEGAQVSFNEDGSFHSVMDAVTLKYLVETATAAQGTDRSGYIRHGAAGKTRPEREARPHGTGV